ncbi:alpha-L-fucosidase [Sphingobacterium puteale]|uniref:alpha-L-fucosidase n=1 Tax=Sphingobacterium puteale TaxID=2420510 RepID=UPI003D960581
MNKNIFKTLLLFTVLGTALNASAQQKRETASSSDKFQPTWESLAQYEAPEWFRNAKFGIWAHWGPQCQPEQGDWYARGMYDEGSWQHNSHLKNYGHPSVAGFKDVINTWKAEKWDPERLVALYKKVGAQYFFAMGNHHDNFDLWDSKYQKWNSVNMGPKRDILAAWSKAAKKNSLPFGVSIHSSHAWTWYETAQRADQSGPLKGVPYDGNMTKEDGKGKWWEGYDPKELYRQNHPLSKGSEDVKSLWAQWDWHNGASIPTQEYIDNFYQRTVDMIDTYQPDLLYFDDTTLPLWPISNVGLDIAAHFYNSNAKKNKGKVDAVLFGKILSEQQKECLVWDVERGVPDQVQEKAWQTCTCLGSWHYNKADYENNTYKSSKKVIHMLIDIVSKNGNLLLNVPIKGDGSIDDKEEKILHEIGDWMQINKEGIFDTRPWKIYGEGPSTVEKSPLNAAGFNEDKDNAYTAEDIRFVQKGDAIYAHIMAWPTDGRILIKSLGKKNKTVPSLRVKTVSLLGHKKKLIFHQNEEALSVTLPVEMPNQISLVLKIY